MSNLGYLGNSKLRRAFTQIAMTQDQVDEYRKCAADPVYFIKNYMKIVTLDYGIQKFDLYPYQENMIRTFKEKRFVICLCPRQSGKSITVIGYFLHSILFKENYSIAILAHKGQAANGLLARLKLAYENLPTWLQSGIVEWNKGNIELENGSKIGAFATSADGLRSGSYNCITGDSFVTIKEKNVVRKVKISDLYENMKANSSKYMKIENGDASYVFEKQIYELVQQYNKEFSKQNIVREYYFRKSSYSTEMYGRNKFSGEYDKTYYPRTFVGASIAAKNGRKGQNSTFTAFCFGQNDFRSPRSIFESFLERTELYTNATFRSPTKKDDRKEAYRRNQDQNWKFPPRKKEIGRNQKETIGGHERSFERTKTFRGNERKNKNVTIGENQIERTCGQNKQKPGKNSENGRKTSWYEKIGRSSNENVFGQKRFCSVEQREERNIFGGNFEENEPCKEVFTQKGFRKFYGISRIKKDSPLLKLTMETGETITCTPDHKIMTDRGFKAAIMCPGRKIQTISGYANIIDVDIVSSEYVYDLLEVEETHSFFANDILVHNCIFLDEFAFVPNNIAEQFFESTYPVISSGKTTKIIIVSTPRGLNHFYTMWTKAEKGLSDYHPIRVHWWDVPGRDEAWKEETIRNTDPQKFLQEFESVTFDSRICTSEGETTIGELYEQLKNG